MTLPRDGWDVVVVGSGFGGTMAARPLVLAGLDVLMLEQGDWVEQGPRSRAWSVCWAAREGYSGDPAYTVAGESRKAIGAFRCVGGASLFYGGVGLRLREEDFSGYPEISRDVRWPFDYGALRPFYAAAEEMMGLRGNPEQDPTEPPRDRPLRKPDTSLSPTSRALARAARRLGHHPFRLPLAVGRDGGATCEQCVCDGFPCHAKNDLATAVLPELIADRLTVRPNTVVCRLEVTGGRVSAVHAVDRCTGETLTFKGDRVVVAAGALATPHLLLASGLDQLSPAGQAVGRHLMRHCNGIVLGGASPEIGDPRDHRKQIGIHDFYGGDPDDDRVPGKLGAIQQLRAVRIALAMAPLAASVRKAIYPVLSRVLGLIVMAEDQPLAENRVWIDPERRDRYDRPEAHVHHRHSRRDRRARKVLADRAAEVLREAHAAFTLRLPVRTFSHALGTVRMGEDRERFPVAPDGRFRGTENLWITDASVFPTSGSVNPSLTIAANALRIATGMVEGRRREEAAEGRPAATSGAPAP